jgi:hypothetical protein
VIFAREQYSASLVAEMRPLWETHYAETHDDKYGPLDPDMSFYEKAQGILRIFTARRDGVLVGYQVYFVMNDPHSRASVQAVQDILFVHPSARGTDGYRFMKWCVAELEREGVDVIHQRIPARHDFGHILERMGFELSDLTYAKRVRRLQEVA